MAFGGGGIFDSGWRFMKLDTRAVVCVCVSVCITIKLIEVCVTTHKLHTLLPYAKKFVECMGGIELGSMTGIVIIIIIIIAIAIESPSELILKIIKCQMDRTI